MEFRNFLLAALGPGDAAVLVPRLKEVSLTAGQVLHETERMVEVLYFPSSACTSVAALMRDGKAFEIATIGRESAPGLLDLMTGRPSETRCFVQIAGSALSLPASAFRDRLAVSPTLMRLALLHVRAVSRQAEALVACNLAMPPRRVWPAGC